MRPSVRYRHPPAPLPSPEGPGETSCSCRPEKAEQVCRVMATASRPLRMVVALAALTLCFSTPASWAALPFGAEADPAAHPVKGPLNATYRIETSEVRLIDGRSDIPAAPGAATRTSTRVVGQPVFGDLDGDGDEDVVLLLVHDPGGSGTFFYLAAALWATDRFQGTPAVFLGDRIAVGTITVIGGVVLVGYLDRRSADPMGADPTVAKSTALALQNDRLAVIAASGDGNPIVAGHVTIGHEVRSFTPCGGRRAQWLRGDSPALGQIVSSHKKTRSGSSPYPAVFMILAGRETTPPTDGFGADYEDAFLAMQWVRTVAGGTCPGHRGVFDWEAGRPPQINLDVAGLDENGLFGPTGGKRALAYEFCIPDTDAAKAEVTRLDPTLQITPGSPGRIGCTQSQSLCIGSTAQKNFRQVLRQLASLPYVENIGECVFE